MKNRNRGIKSWKSWIKSGFFCFLLLTSLLLISSVFAEDTIKVLILENPYAAVPDQGAENAGIIKGKISTNGQVYNGYIEVKKDRNGLYLINEIPFEKYVEGVVAEEAGKGWNLEALKVQAVIVRTYAAYYRNLNAGKDYHLTSSVLSQVYKGENTDSLIASAVRETAGEILTYEGKPVEAFYHSTCGGKTELPEEVWGEGKKHPYLKSTVCFDESSPYNNWKRKFSFEEIERVLGIKQIRDISIASVTSTGRVKALKILAETAPASERTDMPAAEQIEFKAADLRRLLGYKELPSTLFTINVSEKEAVFTGKGYGHGIGLCQWGALEMTKQGKNYKEILEYYYPGTVLEKQGAREQEFK